jgi:hypothetical protein
MKRVDKVLNASSLHRFIATIFSERLTIHRRYFLQKTSFNASSPLIFKRNSSFNASLTLFLNNFAHLCVKVAEIHYNKISAIFEVN